jgi:predicted DNA-binding ribbon-helix-helix protein
MKSTIIKRSIVLRGHKTSVSLEAEFWDGLREIACAQKAKLTELAQQIDQDRKGGNLSSAIRVFVLNHLHVDGSRSSMTNEDKLEERAADGQYANN